MAAGNIPSRQMGQEEQLDLNQEPSGDMAAPQRYMGKKKGADIFILLKF